MNAPAPTVPRQHWVVPRPSVLRKAVWWFVAVMACATVGLAPLDEYVRAIHPQAAKLPAVLLILAWCAGLILDRRPPRVHPVHVLLGLLMMVVLISTSLHLTDRFAMDYAIRWVPFLLVTVILVDVCATQMGIEPILWSALAGAAVAGGGALFSVFALGDRRATGPLEDPNDLAYVLIAALPLAVALAYHRRWGSRNLLLTGIAVLLLLAAAATLSRGAAVGATVAIVWLIARRALRPGAVIAIVGLLAAGVLVIFLSASSLILDAFDQKRFVAADNVDSRLLRWQAAGRILAENPWFGAGPGGVRSNYVAASGLAEIAEQTPVTHNMYLEVGADLGVLGLLLFVGIIVLAFVSAERARRHGAPHLSVVATQASLLAIVAMSYFLSEEYYMSLWSMIAVACALDLHSRETEPSDGGDRASPAFD